MAYLVPSFCIEDLVVYNAKRKFKFVNEVYEFDDRHRFEMITTGNPEEYLPLVITIVHSKLWFEEQKFFGRKRTCFIPSLQITVKLNNDSLKFNKDVSVKLKSESLLFTERVLLNDHIGFGLDFKSFLLGGSHGKYKLSYNGLNGVLEPLRTDEHRLVNFTLDDELTNYAERGFLDKLLRFRKEFGNFDFEVIN